MPEQQEIPHLFGEDEQFTLVDRFHRQFKLGKTPVEFFLKKHKSGKPRFHLVFETIEVVEPPQQPDPF